MVEIKLPVMAGSSDFFIDAEGNWVSSDDIAAALNAAPTRAFGELSSALWGIYKAAADAAEAVAGDPGGFTTSAYWDYYERRLVDELEERLQAFAAPQVPQWQPITVQELARMREEVFLEAQDQEGHTYPDGKTMPEFYEALEKAADALFVSKLNKFAAPGGAARPFRTAPKTGEVILVWRDDLKWFTAFYIQEDAWTSTPDNPPEGEYRWFATNGDDLTGDLPNHWMPLPAAPEAQGGAE